MFQLSSSWRRAWQGIGATGSGADICARLLERYAEPHRHYHTAQHLTECLLAFDGALALAERPADVEMALWFHNALYDVHRSDNEAQSADWAREALLAHGASAQAAEHVHALVMATRRRSLSGQTPRSCNRSSVGRACTAPATLPRCGKRAPVATWNGR